MSTAVPDQPHPRSARETPVLMKSVLPVGPPPSQYGHVRVDNATSAMKRVARKQSKAIAARASAFQQAAVVIVNLVRNSAIAVAGSWCVTYAITTGNVFSRSTAAEQSLVSFTCAVVAWTTAFIGVADAALHGSSLLHGHLVSNPDKRPSWWWSIGMVLWRTLHWLALTVMTCIGVTYGLFVCLPSVRKWKPYFYITVVISHVYRTRVIQEVQRVFGSVTIEGHSRGALVLNSSWRRLLLKNMSMLLSVYVAVAYVQGAAQLDLHSATSLFAFAAVSLTVKLLMQEASIHTAMKRKRIQIERMHAMIAIPTVLIDTQVRILLLRASEIGEAHSSSQTGISTSQVRWLGSLALGVFEIVVRVSKTLWLKMMIRRRWRERDIPRKRTVFLSSSTVQPFGPGKEPSTASDVDESVQSCSEFQFHLWKSRRLALQAAEAQADMHAEYIAIGCSLSIYHLFHGHSKFAIDATAAVSSPHRVSAMYAEIIAFQVATELLVDFVCTTVEISSGISFKVPPSMGVFLLSLYISCALGNIALSSTMFLVHDVHGGGR